MDILFFQTRFVHALAGHGRLSEHRKRRQREYWLPSMEEILLLHLLSASSDSDLPNQNIHPKNIEGVLELTLYIHFLT